MRLIPDDHEHAPSTRVILVGHDASNPTIVTDSIVPLASRALMIFDLMLSHASTTVNSSWHIVVSANGVATDATTSGKILFNGHIGNGTNGATPVHVNFQTVPFLLETGDNLGYWCSAGNDHGGGGDSDIRIWVRYAEVYGSK